MMKRGIIEPLNMTFKEAIKRVVKAGDGTVKQKRDKVKKRPVRQSASPPVRQSD